jgi:hypothetical protein
MNLVFSSGTANPTATMDNATQQKSIAAVLVEPISLGYPLVSHKPRGLNWSGGGWRDTDHRSANLWRSLVLVEGILL